MALNYVTVTGTFDDGSGNPIPATGQQAYCQFTPNQAVYASGIPVITPAQPITATIHSGSMSVQLLATDNTGLTFGGLTGFFFWTVSLVIGGQAQSSWSFFLPHTPSPVDLSALVNTAASGGGAILPLTTLGDTLYENGTPAPARLPGNTTSAKQFLTQTGTGTVSAAPAWGAIAAGDVPGFDGVTVTGTPSAGMVPTATSGAAATWQASTGIQSLTFTYGSTGAIPSSGTFAAGAVAVDQNNIVRVCIASGTPGTWNRVGAQPGQFWVQDYGAKGDGRVVADGVTTANTTFTSASAGFTSADTGKYIMAHGGNGNAAPLMTTITFVNSTTVTLANAAVASGTSLPFIYGTDDVTAINNCFTAASSYAQTFSATSPGSGNYNCEVIFDDRIYVLGTGPTQAGNGTSTVTTNTQIPIPYPPVSGSTQKLIFKMTGTGAGYTVYWQAVTPQVSGTALVSILPSQPGNTFGTFGMQSVVGGPAWGTTAINPGFPSAAGGPGFANVKPVIKGISVWLPVFTNITAWDLGACCQAEVRSCNAMAFAPPGVGGGVSPHLADLTGSSTFKSTVSCGFISPQFQNNADLYWDDCTVQGLECSFRVYDHFRANTLRSVYSDVALNVDRNATNESHLISISNMDAESYNGGLQGPQNPGMSHIDITWSAECGSVVYDISDPLNTLYGRFHFQDSADQGRGITITGGAHLKVITDELGPGHMSSPPSVPATTVAATQVWRDAWVSVHTGAGVTVSAITVDGTATGQTIAASGSAQVRVPSGKTIALTYAGGTPTWDWWLD